MSSGLLTPPSAATAPPRAGVAAGTLRPVTAGAPRPAAARRGLFRAGPAWPLTAMLVGFPVWWALGLGSLVFPLLCVPMGVRLLRMRRVRVPGGFPLWLLFLVWLAVGLLVLNVQVPGTGAGSPSGALLSYAFRASMYLSATVILLFIGNLTEQELPRLRVAWMMGVLFLYTVAGGLAGLIAPTFEFTSPVEMVLPATLASNSFVQDMVHPGLSQVQDFLGYSQARPKAPFDYTNAWGANLTYLLPFFVVAFGLARSPLRRLFAAVVLVITVVPVVGSLNRGVWIALGISTVAAAYWLVRAGRWWAAPALAAAGVLVVGGLAVTPLGSTVADRLATPHSNERRTTLFVEAVDGAVQSPVIGWGSTRPSLGSEQSIAAGPSAECPLCGTPAVGTHGQLWLVLFAHGFVGAVFFFGFFVYTLLRHWRDPDPLAAACRIVILLWLFYAFIYNGLPSALQLVMVAVALLWRGRLDRAAAGSPVRTA